jgi:hypothetical protein
VTHCIEQNLIKMNQCERAELINRLNYWGIIDAEDVRHVLFNVTDWTGLPNSGWFLWEPANKSLSLSPHIESVVVNDDSYILGITHLHEVVSENGKKRSAFSDFDRYYADGGRFRLLLNGVDAYTVYIVKSNADRRYYEFSEHTTRLYRNRIPNSEEYRQMYSSRTLNEAIECVVRMDVHTPFRKMQRECKWWMTPPIPPPPQIICPAIPRFIRFNKQSNSCTNRVWSLKSLCLFFVKNYWKIYGSSQYMGPHLPQRIKTLISDMRVVVEADLELQKVWY